MVKITFGAAIASCGAASAVQTARTLPQSLQWDGAQAAKRPLQKDKTPRTTHRHLIKGGLRAHREVGWVIHFIRMLCLALSTKSTHRPHCAAAAD